MAKQRASINLLLDVLFLVLALLPGLLFLHQTYDLILHRTTVWAQHQSVFEHLDFVSFYACGTMLLHGQSRDIYDTSAQLAAYNQVISPARVPYTNFLQHLPYVFSFLPLLALMPLRTAYLVWSAASISFAFVGTCICRLAKGYSEKNGIDPKNVPISVHFVDRLSFEKQTPDVFIFFLLMLSSLPGNFCLLDGQLSWFYFLIMAMFCWSFFSDRQKLCGLALALLSIKPQYFVFLLVPLIVLKKKKALITTALVLALLIVIGGLTVGWQNLWHYPQILLHGESTEHFALERPKTMISVRSVLSLLLPNRTALLGCFIFELLAFVLTIFVWLRAKTISIWQSKSRSWFLP